MSWYIPADSPAPRTTFIELPTELSGEVSGLGEFLVGYDPPDPPRSPDPPRKQVPVVLMVPVRHFTPTSPANAAAHKRSRPRRPPPVAPRLVRPNGLDCPPEYPDLAATGSQPHDGGWYRCAAARFTSHPVRMKERHHHEHDHEH